MHFDYCCKETNTCKMYVEAVFRSYADLYTDDMKEGSSINISIFTLRKKGMTSVAGMRLEILMKMII